MNKLPAYWKTVVTTALIGGTVALLADTLMYSYDSAGRLIKIDHGNGFVTTYTYDQNGNLLARSVQGPPAPSISSVSNGGSDVAPNTWIVIQGSGFVPARPGGITVTVDGKAAFIDPSCSARAGAACSSDQIRVLTPVDCSAGRVPIVVSNPGGSSQPFFVSVRAPSQPGKERRR
jgi:YD repeat-containing protein